jgi:hypothetical protein
MYELTKGPFLDRFELHQLSRTGVGVIHDTSTTLTSSLVHNKPQDDEHDDVRDRARLGLAPRYAILKQILISLPPRNTVSQVSDFTKNNGVGQLLF